MPPRDPRLRPALERALPCDSGTFRGYRADGGRLLVLFGDREWHPVRVLARWTDRQGREVVQIEWTADASTWTGSYLADAGRVREG